MKRNLPTGGSYGFHSQPRGMTLGTMHAVSNGGRSPVLPPPALRDHAGDPVPLSALQRRPSFHSQPCGMTLGTIIRMFRTTSSCTFHPPPRGTTLGTRVS